MPPTEYEKSLQDENEANETRINDLENELTAVNKQLSDLEIKATGLETLVEIQEQTLQQIANLIGDS